MSRSFTLVHRRSARPVLALAAGLGLLTVACGAAGAAPGAPSATRTRDRAAALEALFRTQGPSVALSTAYAALPPEARYALLEKLRQMVLAQVPPDLASHPGIEQLPDNVRRKVKMILMFMKAVTPEQMDAYVSKTDLDHLAPVPAEMFQVYHQKVLGEPAPGGTAPRAAQVAADRADPDRWRDAARATPAFFSAAEAPPAALEMLGPGDTVPAGEAPRPSIAPAPNGLGVKVRQPIQAPDHVLANSGRLATALNHLANPGTTLSVRAGGEAFEARNGVELLNGLLSTGRYDVEVHDARMFVNFVDLWVPHGQGALPVRVPSWIATGVDPSDPRNRETAGELIIPANHSEHLLVLFERGSDRPAALVRWFLGIPGAELLQGSVWRPAIMRRASWSGYRIVRSYNDPASARHTVQAAAELMRVYNFVQGRHRFQANGYGAMGVCNDTSGLLEGVLQGRTGASTIWPLFRNPDLDFYFADSVARLGLRMEDGPAGLALNIPSDARPDHYPWVKDRRVLLHRIGANVPFRDPAKLHFPQLAAGLEALAQQSPGFAQALGMRAVGRR